MNDFKILFSGTPDFAVESLIILVENGYNICGVITAPDKTRSWHANATISRKKYALSKGLYILQPEKLKDAVFLSEVASLKADLYSSCFQNDAGTTLGMPRLGTLNLHASLLPQYRGLHQ